MVLAITSTTALTWTAIGTLVLAVVTLTAVVVSTIALRQTRADIALSRKEVEEAHRPVVVPVADRRRLDPAGPGVSAGPTRPKPVKDEALMVPIENIGSGPALHLEARIVQWLTESGEWSQHGPGPQTPASAAGLGVGVVMPLEIKLHGIRGVSGFWLTLTYSDVAGKGWITKARYVPDRERYEDVTINTQAEGPYGLKSDAELVKPVPAGGREG
jgi:hypothetical protein